MSLLQMEYPYRAIVDASMEYLDDEVFAFAWVIGCTGFVKICLAIFYQFRRRLQPRFLGLSTWFSSIKIYIGAAVVDVLVCFGSLLRINLSYLRLAIVPLMAIIIIIVLCLRHNQLSGPDDFKSGSSRTDTDDRKKKVIAGKNNDKKSTVMPEYFNIVVLLAPHMILSVSGVVGDPDHDGNKYDIFNFFLFLTCMLQDVALTVISRGIAPASELLYKASLVLLLLTAHILAANAFGEKVVLVLLPEVVPPLIWFSLHLDRRTPIINVQTIVGSKNIYFKAFVVAMCGIILPIVPKDEVCFYWTGWACLASAVMTYIIVLVLDKWHCHSLFYGGSGSTYGLGRAKAGIATLSSTEVLELLTYWGEILVKAAAGLFALRTVALLKSTFGP